MGEQRQRTDKHMNQGGSSRSRKAATSRSSVTDEAWLIGVAEGASKDSGGVSTEFLAGYLPMLADAATVGRSPKRAEIDAVRLQGRAAAESGVPVGRGVDLYLSAARRIWDELPAVIRQRDNKAVRAAAEALLQVVDEAVASFADGHAEAGRELIRKEETLRRDLVDDLLRGDAHLSELVGRAEPFGLDLTRAHQVALAQPAQRLPSIEAATSALERVVLDRFGDRDVLVATKEGLVVVIALADATGAPATTMGLATTGSLGKTVHSELSRLRRGSPWRVAIGRAHPGAYGIARSYEEARDGLTMATRMHLDSPIVETRDLLTYRVLARDQPALTDLVYSVLHPLRQARGGPGPLVETLAAYFDCGCVATAAAARLHLSVRAVTYRLDRVRSLTGFDPLDPAHRYTLQTAVLGAKLLDWPERHLPDSATRS
jgi:sugar diacid utilization regulator